MEKFKDYQEESSQASASKDTENSQAGAKDEASKQESSSSGETLPTFFYASREYTDVAKIYTKPFLPAMI